MVKELIIQYFPWIQFWRASEGCATFFCNLSSNLAVTSTKNRVLLKVTRDTESFTRSFTHKSSLLAADRTSLRPNQSICFWWLDQATIPTWHNALTKAYLDGYRDQPAPCVTRRMQSDTCSLGWSTRRPVAASNILCSTVLNWYKEIQEKQNLHQSIILGKFQATLLLVGPTASVDRPLDW
jgi:hypothetical protein